MTENNDNIYMILMKNGQAIQQLIKNLQVNDFTTS